MRVELVDQVQHARPTCEDDQEGRDMQPMIVPEGLPEDSSTIGDKLGWSRCAN
jgi:hypothetical protein